MTSCMTEAFCSKIKVVSNILTSSIMELVWIEKNTFLELSCPEEMYAPKLKRSQSWSEPSGTLGGLAEAKQVQEPRPDSPPVSAHGDESPSSETCNPCVFFLSIRGCQKECGFCHGAHETTLNKRPRKSTRDRLKGALQELMQNVQDTTVKQSELQSFAGRSPYARSLTIGMLDETD